MFHCLGRRNIIFIDVSIMILGLADMRSSVFFFMDYIKYLLENVAAHCNLSYTIAAGKKDRL